MASVPTVAVLVLNQDGREHPDACLSSLEVQEYPRDRFIIEVVDAPGARNLAAEQARTEFVAFLNHDTHVDPNWLQELTAAVDRHSASAVASKIVDWEGKGPEAGRTDVSFTGHIFPREAVGADNLEGPQLFACGASALFNRAAFLEARGFDRDFVAGFEDLDLGWRLNLLGYRTVLAPRAVTHRRKQDGWARLAGLQRVRLCERSALATIYKNYDSQTLERVLPVAIALSLARGLERSGIDTLNLEFGEPLPPAVSVAPRLAAHLLALEDFCSWLPALGEKRRVIQDSRRRSDADLIALFGDALRLHEIGSRYEDIARALIEDFGLDEIFRPGRNETSMRAAGNLSPPRREEIHAAPTTGVPKVSVIVLTALGTEHLRDCLSSLRTQDYPADQRELIIVDNGSETPVTAEIEAWYPGAKIVRNPVNLGFAASNNAGARLATGQYLFFLNDDTRVDPDCLRELTETARRHQAAAVGACMLDWEGRTIDFAGGAVTFEGKGLQPQHGVGKDALHLSEKPLMFACGGAMLVDRAVFTSAGGWDDGAFAYYEDVELGWRLNLFGHQIWFAPRALVYHKQSGTAGRWADAPRTRLFQRNSLRMLYCLLNRKSLERVLPAALLLAADRALLLTTLSRASEASAAGSSSATGERLVESAKAALRVRGIHRRMSIGAALGRLGLRGTAGVASEIARAALRGHEHDRMRYGIEAGAALSSAEPRDETISLPAAAILSGVFGFLVDLPALSARRRDIQRRRHLEDQEFLQAFGVEWTTPSGSVYPTEHAARQRQLAEEFGIARLASGASAPEPVPSRSDALRGR